MLFWIFSFMLGRQKFMYRQGCVCMTCLIVCSFHRYPSWTPTLWTFMVIIINSESRKPYNCPLGLIRPESTDIPRLPRRCEHRLKEPEESCVHILQFSCLTHPLE